MATAREASRRRREGLTRLEIEEAIGPLENYRHRCHEASLAIVQSGIIDGRVGRGRCRFVPNHQHSWVVIGNDPYSRHAELLDVTAWSYDSRVPKVFYTRNLVFHVPHGYGHWQSVSWVPKHHGGPTVKIRTQLSSEAQHFLNQFGPLDVGGWRMIAHLPVQGWPAAEIIRGMVATPQLRALVPIDVVGMLTSRNPGGLYLPKPK